VSSPKRVPEFPATACLLSSIGGALITVFAVYELTLGIFDPSVVESVLPGSQPIVIALGVMGLVVGPLIMGLSVQLRRRPASARRLGWEVAVLGLVSFFGGGGLYVGLVLSVVGGLLAVRWQPTVVARPLSYSAPVPPPPLGSALRPCPSCGATNVAAARYCATCGASLS
jgi:hypothetical protein